MTSYRNKYLEMLKTDFGKKPLPEELPKLTKPPLRSSLNNFVSFVSSQDRPVSDFSPPLDAEGVPCGLCPTCRRGEFWRWPKFHKDHNPTGWGLLVLLPASPGGGPCDFCGVPD